MSHYGTQLARFEQAAKDLTTRQRAFPDTNVDHELRSWLDGNDKPLDWQHHRNVTSDEYFFITTLYGNMPLSAQRTMIRKYFGALLVDAAKRDVRNFRLDVQGYEGLRSPWMKLRLCKMASILGALGYSMQEYVTELRALEGRATADDPTPALNRIVRDHGATGIKTLSVFIRDCVRGNSFPIDLRVRRYLAKYSISENEKRLVRMSLELGYNPRELARLFYEGSPEDPATNSI